MGAWVYVRGWLEFAGQRAEAMDIIRRGEPEGWAFPEGGWLDAACYARGVRDADEVLVPLRRIAALPAVDEDGDRVCGLFFAYREGSGQEEWQVRDGDVIIGAASSRYDYLWR
ncbi:hypothetical protein [Nonomuraea gerenzanensis]|uniref:Uncharacterized protein n=1 Tax=Nonomuraea gerenzanensis TaxID=93944 RepID=A0A1M4EKP9_9ACTN|nr:hypothetical protein [Nonomuraea gerenzanensis]UBU10889.1 hypothetical protein LCN96_42210 [Nonomuraea gerenzanensis]SBO99328.1 hypothetical protein BN4615_P8844 [Nonomuraea gerenzanensis]